MTAILVTLTIVLFLAVDYLRTRRQRAPTPVRAAIPVQVSLEDFLLPEGLFVSPGHTWARLEPDGSVLMGIDDFAARVLGRIDQVEVAAEGADVTAEEAALVLHQKGKSVAFASPVEGTVTAINAEALRRPASLRASPYDSGWLLRLRPRQLAAELRRLRIGDEARSWLREEVARFGEFLGRQIPADAVGVTLQDGGLPVADVLEQLDGTTWEHFESEFLARSG